MANIIVTATPVDVNVSTTLSNIVVTDLESNNTVNVTTTLSNVSVTSTPVNVSISQSVGVSNAEIRAALSATTPIVFDNNTGEFTFDPSANNMQVTSLTASSFVTTTGNLTSSGLSVSGNATVGGLLNVANISIAGDLNANLKDISLSYYDAGNVSGNVTLDVANGPVQKIRLTNNLTGLSFTGATAAQPITLIIQQDNVGFWSLDTTTHASNWTNWLFTSNFKTLSTTANASDLLSITYNGTNYFASLVNFVQTLITNAELANSNVVINGITIPLGSSATLTTANIAEGGSNLYLTNARVRAAISATSPISFNNSTGVISFVNGLIDFDAIRLNNTNNYPGTSLIVGRYNTTSDAAQFNGNVLIKPETAPTEFAGLKLQTNLTGATDNLNTLFHAYGSQGTREVIINANVTHGNGNITTTGNVTATGNIQGNFFLGNGSQLTGITSLTNAQVVAHIATVPLTVGGNLTVNGNINATGNINVQNVEDLYVRDQTIVLNANAASPANVQIVSNRPGFANTEIKWNEQSDRWTFTNDGSTYYNLPTSTSDVAEGTNLYYTTDRANTAIGAYQGNINTAGTITAGTITAGALLGDGSNIQYVRAFSADLVTDSGANGLNVVLESQSNNRLAKADSDSFRYVPSTRTVLVSDGFIGSSAANTSFSGVNLLLTGNINASTGNMSVGNILVNTVTAGSLSGNGVNITAITGANVFGLVTTQVSEGTNLYFTTDRANTAIGAYQGAINTAGNITTSANVSGQYILGNGSQLTNIPANITGSENITVSGNAVSLKNALGNVNSVTSEASTNLTVNTNNKLAITQNFKGRAVASSANVEHDGYGFFRSNKTFTPVTSYTGNANIENFIFATGNTTAGSNAITGVSLVEWFNEVTPANISNVAVNSVFSLNQNSPYPFSYGACVTSVDAANSTIYMNQAAGFTQDLTKGTLYFFLQPALLDTQTGQAIRLVSQFDANVSPRSKTVLQTSDVMFPGRYGYPQSGFAISDFDVFTAGVAGDYTLGDSSTMMVGRNKLTAPTTVLTAPRGMIVGNNADLTNRAENDTISSFGVNVLWDGTDTSYVNTTSGSLTGPLTQILVKNYTDNNLQGFSTNRSFFGPRLFFTAAEGNALEPYTVTYPLNNLELGRIAFWCASQTQPSPGSGVPPAFISVVTNRDMTGSHNGGVGMYLSASPNTDAGRRGLFAAHQLGKTLIASGNATTTGASEPITFAPMWTSVAQSATGGSNAVAQFNNTFGATNYQWANVNYDNASGKTGSRLSVTNGASTVSARNGNLVIAIDRNDNGAGFGSKEWAFKLRNGQTNLVLTEDDVIRTTFAGGNITATAFYGDGGNLTNITATANTFDNIVVAGQSNVVASGSSNLTLVAGSGMSITTDAGTDTITFASTGGYGNAEVAAFLAAYGSNTVVTTGNITASNFIGNVSGTTGNFSGTVTATEFVGGGSDLTDVRAKTIELTVKNISGANIAKGYPLHVVSATAGGTPEVVLADAGNAALMPAHYIAGEDLAIGAEGRGIVSGEIRGINTSSFLIGEVIYVAVGGGYANVAPSGESNIIQNLGIVSRVDAVNGGGEIFGAGRGAATPALNTGNVFIGGAGNVTVTKPLTTAITDANVKLKQFAETVVSLGSVSGDISGNIDVANGTIYQITANGNITINSLANAAAGTSATLIVTQDGTGGRTLTSTMKFASASKTLSTAANSIDIISVFYDGSTYYATLSKGYA